MAAPGPGQTGAHSLEHLASLDGGEPEAVCVGVVVAGPTAMALDERCTSKLFQTGAGGSKGLAGTFSTGTGVLSTGKGPASEIISRHPVRHRAAPTVPTCPSLRAGQAVLEPAGGSPQEEATSPKSQGTGDST